MFRSEPSARKSPGTICVTEKDQIQQKDIYQDDIKKNMRTSELQLVRAMRKVPFANGAHQGRLTPNFVQNSISCAARELEGSMPGLSQWANRF